MFTWRALPFHSGAYVSGHFNRILNRESTPREHTQHMCMSLLLVEPTPLRAEWIIFFLKACTV